LIYLQGMVQALYIYTSESQQQCGVMKLADMPSCLEGEDPGINLSD